MSESNPNHWCNVGSHEMSRSYTGGMYAVTLGYPDGSWGWWVHGFQFSDCEGKPHGIEASEAAAMAAAERRAAELGVVPADDCRPCVDAERFAAVLMPLFGTGRPVSVTLDREGKIVKSEAL